MYEPDIRVMSKLWCDGAYVPVGDYRGQTEPWRIRGSIHVEIDGTAVLDQLEIGSMPGFWERFVRSLRRIAETPPREISVMDEIATVEIEPAGSDWAIMRCRSGGYYYRTTEKPQDVVTAKSAAIDRRLLILRLLEAAQAFFDAFEPFDRNAIGLRVEGEIAALKALAR